MVHEAFYVARSGRPGPVVIDLPKDILIGKAPYTAAGGTPHRSYRPQTEPDAAQIARAVAMLKSAKRPIIYTGGGVINAGAAASEALARFVRKTGFPCTSTLMGLGAFPASDPQFLGMLGMHGTYEANLAMHGCDVMLNVGARFDDRVTGRLNAFSPGSRRKSTSTSTRPASTRTSPVDVPIVADAGRALTRAAGRLGRRHRARLDRAAIAAWWAQIDAWRGTRLPALHPGHEPGAIIKPQYAIQRLYELTRERSQRPSSPPKSASTRCGPPSISGSSGRTTG